MLWRRGYGRGGRLGHPEFEIHSGSSAVILPTQVEGLGKRKVCVRPCTWLQVVQATDVIVVSRLHSQLSGGQNVA